MAERLQERWRCRRSFGFFFFQAEDGIRDYKVTGVQTCALPIWPAVTRRIRQSCDHLAVRSSRFRPATGRSKGDAVRPVGGVFTGEERVAEFVEIGRASCRERV